MALSHKPRSAIGYVLLITVIAAIGITGALTYVNIATFASLAGERVLSSQILSALDTVLSRLHDLEAAETGSAAAMQEPSLTQYHTAVREVGRSSDAVKA